MYSWNVPREQGSSKEVAMKAWIFCLLLFTSTIAFAQPQGPDTMWTRVFTGLGQSLRTGVVCWHDGKTVVSGVMNFMNNLDLFLLQLDSLGNTDTLRHFGVWNEDEDGGTLCRTTDGGFALAGRNYGLHHGAYLVRLDSEGSMLWERFYGFYQNVPTVYPTHDNGANYLGLWL